MYYTRQAVGMYNSGGNNYSPPTRGYSFDVNFLNPTLLPPRTPMFRDINTTGFTHSFCRPSNPRRMASSRAAPRPRGRVSWRISTPRRTEEVLGLRLAGLVWKGEHHAKFPLSVRGWGILVGIDECFARI